MLVLSDVEHASAEVLRPRRRLSGQQLERLPDSGVLDDFQGFHNSARRGNVDIVPEAFRSLLECFLCGGLAYGAEMVR